MIAFLPELPTATGVTGGATPGLIGGADGALSGVPQPGSGLDFAGLLNAALPEGEAPAPALTNLPARVPELAASAPSAPAAPVASLAPPVTFTPPAVVRQPDGKILPESGEAVPHVVAPVTPPAAAPLAAAPLAAAPLAEAPDVAPAPVDSESPAPVIAVQLRGEMAHEAPDQREQGDASDGKETDGAPLTPAAPVPVVAALPLPPNLPVTLTAAVPRSANPPALTPLPARAAVRTDESRPAPQAAHQIAPPPRAEHQPLPAAITLPEPMGDGATTASPSPAAMLTEAAEPVAAQLSSPQPAPVTTPVFAAPPTAAPVMAERAEPRSPAPQQESTIAQVGELREALRAVRPEMTMRHAEFGFVSLRIEPTGTQDWRAVLASRDPGFVPAIQAALAERAVAAMADAAGAGNNPGQTGTSDQRYGASPNGGQGSSQPYLSQYGGQSGGRNEGQSPQSHHRQPSTTDAVVARASDAPAERPDRSDRGVFA